ncbi:MAG TPA: hypothetical protein VIQ02_17140, partial [Jiangellaceae bacterium]
DADEDASGADLEGLAGGEVVLDPPADGPQRTEEEDAKDEDDARQREGSTSPREYSCQLMVGFPVRWRPG